MNDTTSARTGFSGVSKALPAALLDRSVLLAVGLAVTGFLGLVAVEAVLFGRAAWHPEESPLGGAMGWVRTGLAVGFSAALLAALRRALPPPPPARPGETRAAMVGAFALLGLAALLAADPVAFGRLTWEDGPVENVSALATGLGALCFFWVALSSGRRRAWAACGGALVLGLGLVALTGEEISWGQRLLGVETPGGLAGINDQGEMNLHNVVTEESELLYYVGGFALLVGLPLVADDEARRGPLGPLLPARLVGVVAAPMAALNFDLWGVVPVQMSFWLTAAALLWWGRGRGAFALLAVSLLIAQIALLVLGPEMIRRWDVKEYKELFLALGFLAYAVSAARAERAVARG